MSSLPHQRLLSEATSYGTAEILRHMPAAYSPELEEAIRHGVHEAVQYYADSLDTLSGPLPPLHSSGKAST